MKTRLLFLITAILFLVSGKSQTSSFVKKVHAYKQESIPGIIMSDRDEDGHIIQRERIQTFNYWFYFEYESNAKITITDLWISGKRFLLKIDSVSETPLKMINYSGGIHGDTVILVPKTKNKVILIYPSGENNEEIQLTRKIMDEIKKQELVIRYNLSGKNYIVCRKTLKILKPEVRQ